MKPWHSTARQACATVRSFIAHTAGRRHCRNGSRRVDAIAVACAVGRHIGRRLIPYAAGWVDGAKARTLVVAKCCPVDQTGLHHIGRIGWTWVDVDRLIALKIDTNALSRRGLALLAQGGHVYQYIALDVVDAHHPQLTRFADLGAVGRLQSLPRYSSVMWSTRALLLPRLDDGLEPGSAWLQALPTKGVTAG